MWLLPKVFLSQTNCCFGIFYCRSDNTQRGESTEQQDWPVFLFSHKISAFVILKSNTFSLASFVENVSSSIGTRQVDGDPANCKNWSVELSNVLLSINQNFSVFHEFFSACLYISKLEHFIVFVFWLRLFECNFPTICINFYFTWKNNEQIFWYFWKVSHNLGYRNLSFSVFFKQLYSLIKQLNLFGLPIFIRLHLASVLN